MENIKLRGTPESVQSHLLLQSWLTAMPKWLLKLFKGGYSSGAQDSYPRAATTFIRKIFSLYPIRLFLIGTSVHCLIPFCWSPLSKDWINGLCNLPLSSRRLELDSPSAFSSQGLKTPFTSACPSHMLQPLDCLSDLLLNSHISAQETYKTYLEIKSAQIPSSNCMCPSPQPSVDPN